MIADAQPRPEELLAEAALAAARMDLEVSGSPAYAVVGLGGEHPVVLPFTYAVVGPAIAAADDLARRAPELTVLVVACHRLGGERRWTVTDRWADQRFLTRREVLERPMGMGGMV